MWVKLNPSTDQPFVPGRPVDRPQSRISVQNSRMSKIVETFDFSKNQYPCRRYGHVMFWQRSAVRPLQHEQQHGQRRRWPRPPCSASSAARASQSLARRHLVPPLPRAGVARDVTLGCRAQLNALTPAARPRPRPRPRPPFCAVGGPS